MAKKDLSSLLDRVQKTEIKTPVQMVVPIKPEIEESIFSFYLPTNKLRFLKQKALNENISLKKIMNDALNEKYFKENL